MKLRAFLLLFALGLVINSIIAYFQSSPGYMDADYYYACGLRIANGYGFSEPFLWNYLDDPRGIPHPSHAYWMPLASILAAGGMTIIGRATFEAASVLSIITGALMPPLTAKLAYSIKPDRSAAILAGLLGALPGFYLSFLPTTDTFGLYMLLGALWLILAGWITQDEPKIGIRKGTIGWLALGGIGGLMHLSRADGILWLLFSLFLLGLYQFKLPTGSAQKPIARKRLLINGALIIAGYIVVMGPWMVRNIQAFGAPLAPGGSRALWLTDYDDLFLFPASELTYSRWVSSGFQSILQARLWALGQNLQTTFAVQGEVFLFPLILIGLWRFRKDIRVQAGGLAWLVTFIVMSFVFPYPGARGGFFHSGAALQPLMWALAPFGLIAFVEWGGQVRGWNFPQARRIFGVGLVGLALLLSSLIVRGRVIGPHLQEPLWNAGAHTYEGLATALEELEVSSDEIVMVNNPPGFYLASGSMAIPAPDGDLTMAIQAAEHYDARYLLLEPNHPQGLSSLYRDPGDREGLKYLGSQGETHIFEFEMDDG